MSSNPFDSVVLPWGEVIRDFMLPIVNAGNYIFDIANTGNALGLDIWIHNNGAAALTVSVNGAAAITVNAGAVFAISSTKWWLLTIVSAVNYDLIMSGVRANTLKEKGLL